MPHAILAIDQGTTSTRAIVFGADQTALAMAQEELPQIYPRPGWVEHDPEAIWSSVVATAPRAIAEAGLTATDIAAIGIANQRETALVWDRATGEVLHNAIVWQDRRGAPLCEALKDRGLEGKVTATTGLLLDPYFSASKLAWMLDNLPDLRQRAERGEVCFGTVDSFLIWRLSGGRQHLTDATNAARTLLYDLDRNCWDDEMLTLFGVPRAMLPEIRDCAADFGTTEANLFGAAIPILGSAGDQHAAMIGQACFAPGMMKATYGTGCFALLNTGPTRVHSKARLLSTLAYRLDGESTFALEGSIFVAGAAVQWLRDQLHFFEAASESGELAARADPAQAVYFVPALVGLGAPWWEPDARGAIFGISRNTGPAEITRAALDAVGYQTHDLMEAIQRDWPNASWSVVRADGGMSRSDWTMQRLADLTGMQVDCAAQLERTAVGAAWLAGRQCGLWPDRARFAAAWQTERSFAPKLAAAERVEQISRWRTAVGLTRTDVFA